MTIIDELKLSTVHDKRFKKLKKDFVKIIKNAGVNDIVELYQAAKLVPLLKKHYVRTYDYPEGGNYFCMEFYKFETDEDGELLKEWLENDK